MKINIFLAIFVSVCFNLLGITLDLREPTLSDGVLTTESGGVIEGPDFRLQAKKIAYKKTDCEIKLEAEGDLILEFGDYIFVGRSLVYNFLEKKGILYDGRTSVDPWFLGGEEIILCPDNSFIIQNGFASTSENYKTEWQIEVKKAHLKEKHLLSARDVKFRFFSLPLFWMPCFRINLDSIFDSPFRYTVRFGGAQGPRVGMTYEIFSWERWKTFLRLDYRFKRGLGGGLDIAYKSPNHKEYLRSINYIAEDTTRFDRKERTRYRIYGLYQNTYDCDRTSLEITYDKVSDKEMATDYKDQGLYLDTTKRTQIDLRRQEDNFIMNLLFRFRVNDFQTVKQELPTLTLNFHPYTLGKTGIIAESFLKASYLELEYTEKKTKVHDYNSPRYQVVQTLYRPYNFKSFKFTPEISGVAIYYGNSPDKLERWLTTFCTQATLQTDLMKTYGSCKHVITPYLKYHYCAFPSTPPEDLFVFDIDDGWYYLNALRFGFYNNFFIKKRCDTISRKLYLDLFSYAFFDTHTIDQRIPKIYTDLIYDVNDFMRLSSKFAYDLDHGVIDHLTGRLDWTVSSNLAFKFEYRTRSAYSWRKVDHYNFTLDSFLNEEKLKESSLSDERDTFLFNLFYRFNPSFALQFQSRTGWGRKKEPKYNEYQVDILGTLRSSWHLKFSYRHKENDDRFSINFNIGLKKPEYTSSETPNYLF